MPIFNPLLPLDINFKKKINNYYHKDLNHKSLFLIPINSLKDLYSLNFIHLL